MEALQPRAEGLPAKRTPPPDFSKKSFAQMFATEPQQQLLEFPLSVHKGEVAIKISTAAIDKLAIPFKHALVGKFSHGRPTLEETRKALSKLDFKGALDVGLIDYRHVLLRFHSEADFHRIWTRGIWQIGKYPMRVFKWSPSFQTSKETSIVPVWFELPGLPCHLFDHGVLFSIMKAVGVPLSIDAATLNLARPSVARVNVEIDLMRELPSRIWIEHGDDGEGFWQKLIPEKLPLYCISCFRQGHSQEGCNTHENRVQKLWKPKVDATVTPIPSTATAAAVSKTFPLENSPRTIGVGATVEEVRRSCFQAALADTAAVDPPGVGASMEVVQESELSVSKLGALVAKEIDGHAAPAASAANAAAQPLGIGDMKEDGVQEIAFNGIQKVANELDEDLSLVQSGKHVGSTELNGELSGKHMGSTELDGELFLTPNKLSSTQVSAQKLNDWDYIFQTIAGNILNCKEGLHEDLSAHKPTKNAPLPLTINVTDVDDEILEETLVANLVTKENYGREPHATIDVPSSSQGNYSAVTKIMETNLDCENMNQVEPEIDQRTEFLNNLEKRQCALSYTLPRTESAPLLRIHWLDKESPEPEILDIDAHGKSLYLDDGQEDNTMVKVQFQEQVMSQIIQTDTPVKTSRYNLRSLSKAEISEIQNSKKNKKKEARRNALEFNYSDSDTHIDVNIV